MATNKKSARFVSIGPGVFAGLQLDEDIYTPVVCTALGILTTAPTGTSTTVRLSIKSLRKTGQGAIGRATVRRGTGDAEKTRQIRLVCDREKTGTAAANLKGKTVQLGDAGDTWTISNINFG